MPLNGAYDFLMCKYIYKEFTTIECHCVTTVERNLLYIGRGKFANAYLCVINSVPCKLK